MSTKHTSGPWTQNEMSPSSLTVEDAHAGQGRPICEFPYAFYAQDPETLPQAIEQWHVDARLIRAAPELLALVEELRSEHVGNLGKFTIIDPDKDDLNIKALSVLAKAKGAA